MSDIRAKRETLLTRRGHLIRIVSLLFLFLSIIFVLISNIFIRDNLPDTVGVVGYFSIYFSIFLLLALLGSILASIVLCVGALMAHEFVLEEFKDVLYNGEPVENKVSYFMAMNEADKLIEVYNDTEDRVFRIYIIWGVIAALFLSILLLLVLFTEMAGLTPVENLTDPLPISDYLTEIFIFLLFLPIVLLLIYSLYISYISILSEAGSFVRRKIENEFTVLREVV